MGLHLGRAPFCGAFLQVQGMMGNYLSYINQEDHTTKHRALHKSCMSHTSQQAQLHTQNPKPKTHNAEPAFSSHPGALHVLRQTPEAAARCGFGLRVWASRRRLQDR